MPEYLILATECILAEKQGNVSKASLLRAQSLKQWQDRLSSSKDKGLPSYTLAEVLNRLLDVELAPVAKPSKTSEIPAVLELPAVQIQTLESVQTHVVDLAEHYLKRGKFSEAISCCESETLFHESLSTSLRGRIFWIWARAFWGVCHQLFGPYLAG